MHDLPSITLLQQAHAVPKTGEELEVLGKTAACRYESGECSSLSDAVVETVKHAGLSPEQVKRVTEFTNQAAYLNEFRKLGSNHKYIEFDGGPADPGAVLKDLNDGSGGTVFDRGVLDYASQPSTPVKTASVKRNMARLEKVAQRFMSDADLAQFAGMQPMGMENWRDNPMYQNQRKLQQVAMLSAMTGRQPIKVAAAEEKPLPGNGLGERGRGAPGPGSGCDQPGRRLGQRGEVPRKFRHRAADLSAVQLAGERKQSSAELDFNPAEAAFEDMFRADGPETEPYHEPMQDTLDMREKLAGARDHLTGELGGLELAFGEVLEDMYQQVKQAALQGATLGQVIRAWNDVVPGPEYVKTAFAHIGPRLHEEGVFPSLDSIGESLTKTAATGLVNHSHPLVQSMAAYITVLDKLAHVRAARDELAQEFERIDWFAKRAAPTAQGLNIMKRMAQSGGLIPKVTGAARRAGEAVAPRVQQVGEALLGAGSPAAAQMGQLAGGAVKYTPHAVAGLAGLEAYQRAKYNPAFQTAKNALLGRIPYTHPWQVRQYQLQMGA